MRIKPIKFLFNKTVKHLLKLFNNIIIMNGSNNQYKTEDRTESKVGQVRIKSIYMHYS
jgi:hypothetical protein